jgi:hypothetical protein
MSQNDGATAVATPDPVTRANECRRALHLAMAGLEEAVAGPAAAAGWPDRIESGLTAVRDGLDAHIVEVEGPNGILVDITGVAPRLSAAARQLEDEHVELVAALERTEAALRAARANGAEAHAVLRRRVTSLLGRLTLHRQHGSDLVYEAYNVDIEAGD